MSYKNTEKRNAYYREKYRNDPEFRERMKEANRLCARKRSKEGRMWRQKNPELSRYYLIGYKAGFKRAIKFVCKNCKEKLAEMIKKWRF